MPYKDPQKEKEWRIRNKDRKREYDRNYYWANKDRIQKYRRKNRGRITLQAREWRNKNRERWRDYYNKYRKEQYSNDPKYILTNRIRTRIYESLKGNKGGRHWESLVGYTLEDLKRHLEKQFKPGMSWNNQGSWHVDHIIPISLWKFEKPEDSEFKQCWALCNLQPLWAEENMRKGNKVA